MAEPDIAIDIVSPASKISELVEPDCGEIRPRPRLVLRTLGLIAADATVTVCVAILCFNLFRPLSDVATLHVAGTVASLVLCTTLSFFERGLYAAREVMTRALNWRKIALAWVQAVAVCALVTVCFSTASGNLAGGSRSIAAILHGPWLPTLLVAGFTAITATRLLCMRSNARPALLNRTVIIGEPDSIHDLLQRIHTGRRRGFDVIGIFEHVQTPHAQELHPQASYAQASYAQASKTDAPHPSAVQPAAIHPATAQPAETPSRAAERNVLGLPLFGDLDALERLIRKDAVDTVLVAVPWSASEQARTIVQRVSMAPVDVYVYPGMNAFDIQPRRAASVFELPLLMACARPIDGWGAVIKRAEDVVLSLGLLVAISPVMLAIGAMVKMTSRGPVFFRQRRLGYNNHVIEVLKFRSMYSHLADADAQQQALRGDKRVTRVGAWLRKTSLDELPQLINVLRGDMSLVGPRPHALATTAGGLALQDAVPVYPSRHRVKPGITGWAQVNGYRGALDTVDKIVHRVNHDLYYIENWSLALDLKILWLTIRLVFADDNAF